MIIGADHGGRTLRDHCHDRVRMPAGHGRHHEGIGEPKPFESSHLKSRIDRRQIVGAHSACSGWVIDGLYLTLQVREEVVIACYRGTRRQLGQGFALEWFTSSNLARQARTGLYDPGINAVSVGEQTKVDSGRVMWRGRVEPDSSPST
jgi:hypothetical protein